MFPNPDFKESHYSTLIIADMVQNREIVKMDYHAIYRRVSFPMISSDPSKDDIFIVK